MLKVLTAALCASFLIVTAGQAAAQQNQTPEKEKGAIEKTADKAKDGAQQVGDKADDVKDKTVKGTKTAAKKTKDVAG